MSLRRSALLALVALIAVFALGPRPEAPHPLPLPDLPADLDAWLSTGEAEFTDIVPGTEKRITWAGEPGTRTPLALVYLHGFSASRQELAPLPAEIAAALGANLFEARLSGHGRDGDDLGQATATDWVADAIEALAIGRRLGDRVALLGASTGGTLALWLAATAPGDVDALVLVSPNLGPVRRDADLARLPWGTAIARALVGPEYSFEPVNDAHARYWTERYPVAVVPELMTLVATTREALGDADLPPTLVFVSDRDRIVDTDRTRAILAGHDDVTLEMVTDSDDPSGHVLAGDILSPRTTRALGERAAAFLALAE